MILVVTQGCNPHAVITEAAVMIRKGNLRHTRAFQIEADASKFASGAVLTQEDSNGARHPITFISKTFNDTKRQYEIYDRELLAIMQALREWRHYLHGNPHQTTIYSDHQNLQYFKEPQKLNNQQ